MKSSDFVSADPIILLSNLSACVKNYHGSITKVAIERRVMKTKPKVHRLGDLQLRILQNLWERNEAAVGVVHEALGGRASYAYTTVATMLRKMEARRLVAHREEGRSYIYRALVAAEDVSRGVADHLVDRLFEGRLTDVVSHLLTTREVSRAELSALEKMIAERKKKL